MQRFLICFFMIGVAAERSHAQAPATPKPFNASETYDAIKKEYKEATAKFVAERKAKGNPNGTVAMGEGPYARFAPRFLAFADSHPDDPAAIDALNLALQTSFFSGEKGKDNWARTVELLRKKFVANPEIKQVFLWISVNNHDQPSEAFLREVIAHNPDRVAQGEACQTLVKRANRDVVIGEMLRENSEARKRFEDKEGKAKFEEILAKAQAAEKVAHELTEEFRARYEEFFPSIAIGKPAPELISRDLDGKTVKLTDLRGKVVVLDIWTTWCGPCRAMIPHEREMVKRKRDKPFVLVSISCDEEKKALTDFLAKEPMPWTHWWNGQVGGIMSTWKITEYPTIYILDANGVIRYKNPSDEELEKAVDKLLEENVLKTAG
jgi:thiol-disulfide isomerase/thioredoxin